MTRVPGPTRPRNAAATAKRSRAALRLSRNNFQLLPLEVGTPDRATPPQQRDRPASPASAAPEGRFSLFPQRRAGRRRDYRSSQLRFCSTAARKGEAPPASPRTCRLKAAAGSPGTFGATSPVRWSGPFRPLLKSSASESVYTKTGSQTHAAAPPPIPFRLTTPLKPCSPISTQHPQALRSFVYPSCYMRGSFGPIELP